jgi:hypothetical protein
MRSGGIASALDRSNQALEAAVMMSVIVEIARQR